MTNPTNPTDEISLPIAELPAEAGDAKSAEPVSPNLLDRLLYKGVLPRYAFPTDVATFYVFDENQSQYSRPAFQFSPSQGLSVALSQYAPGKEVWIANRRFISGAIYSPISSDRFNAWSAKRLYYECKNCHYACTRSLEQGQKGETGTCPACGTADSFGQARYWFRPPGFAHPVGIPEGVNADDDVGRSYATRAKLDAPTPELTKGSWSEVTERVRTHYLREQLLVTNTGPKQEGYTYCTRCGRIEPTASRSKTLHSQHQKPYPDQRDPMCPGQISSGICLGTDFITDILLISLRVVSPIRLAPGLLATDIALRTLSESVAKAASVVLGLEQGEVQADYRAALTENGQSGFEVELYLYDTLPGGAGFSRAVGGLASEVFQRAYEILDGCDCNSSCYKCLRSFKNKFEHDKLDRFMGRDLLAYLLWARLPIIDPANLRRSVDLLAEDLRRNAGADAEISTDSRVDVQEFGSIVAPIHVRTDGAEAVVAVSHPLTPRFAPNKSLADLSEFSAMPVLLIHELKIRRNLPAASHEILQAVGIAE